MWGHINLLILRGRAFGTDLLLFTVFNAGLLLSRTLGTDLSLCRVFSTGLLLCRASSTDLPVQASLAAQLSEQKSNPS